MSGIPNLNSIAAGVVSAVNPWTRALIQLSTGSTPNADGTRTPTYCVPIEVFAQVQPTSWKDIQHLDALNIQGIRWKAYINGEVDGLVRPEDKGGDLLTIISGRHQGVWLVAQVLEQWEGWVCAAITLQNGS
jgi:hypothetical protein